MKQFSTVYWNFGVALLPFFFWVGITTSSSCMNAYSGWHSGRSGNGPYPLQNEIQGRDNDARKSESWTSILDIAQNVAIVALFSDR